MLATSGRGELVFCLPFDFGSDIVVCEWDDGAGDEERDKGSVLLLPGDSGREISGSVMLLFGFEDSERRIGRVVVVALVVGTIGRSNIINAGIVRDGSVSKALP